MTATRSKASNLVPESQILLSLSPMFVIDDDEGRDFDASQLAHSLSRTSQHHLRQLSRGGRTPVILNGSVASVGTALAGGVNAAIVTGTSSIITPQGLDEAAFNIHGCIGVGLSLIEMADDADTFCQALEILFGTIKHSWRNSEAMERENGYGILSILLETKLRKLAVFRPPTVAVAFTALRSSTPYVDDVFCAASACASLHQTIERQEHALCSKRDMVSTRAYRPQHSGTVSRTPSCWGSRCSCFINYFGYI